MVSVRGVCLWSLLLVGLAVPAAAQTPAASLLWLHRSHSTFDAASTHPAWQEPGKQEEKPPPPPRVGFSRKNDRTVLECIDLFWHEVTYATYVNDHMPSSPPVIVKVGDTKTGNACHTPEPEHLQGPGEELTDSPNRGLKRREDVVVQECNGGTWHNITFAIVERWGDKDEPDFTIPPIRVRIGDEDTEFPYTAITPQPQPPDTATGGAGTATGTSTLGSSTARSECGDDGFWHVITDEDWVRPDGTHFKKRDDEKTTQTCKPGEETAGVYLGGELIKNVGKVRSIETLAATGVVTNQFDDSGDPLGFGVVAGDNLAVGKIVVDRGARRGDRACAFRALSGRGPRRRRRRPDHRARVAPVLDGADGGIDRGARRRAARRSGHARRAHDEGRAVLAALRHPGRRVSRLNHHAQPNETPGQP